MLILVGKPLAARMTSREELGMPPLARTLGQPRAERPNSEPPEEPAPTDEA